MQLLSELIGDSPGITAVRAQVKRLLQRQGGSHLPSILIQGETGTGKGVLARAIHAASARAREAFVEVNCAAIPETLLEAELFGYERGAFTDARQAKAGLFQTAHRGSIFLDEVGLLPERLQAKLLTVVQERVVRRLGGTRTEPVDVWIVTATNEDLAEAIRARRFREDLYHRLAVLTVTLPPLRQRGDDVLRLAKHFLARVCADYRLPPKSLSPDAEAALIRYSWPGNVRELGNVLERVVLLVEDMVVTAEALGLRDPPGGPRAAGGRRRGAGGAGRTSGPEEREQLEEALRRAGGSLTRAAGLLGIARNTLRYRLDKLGLAHGAPPPPTVPGPGAGPPPGRESPPAALSGPEAAPVPDRPRWERRRLALLQARLVVPESERLAVEGNEALDVVLEKVVTFGGQVEELGPAELVAVFGLDAGEDFAVRAAHAAVAAGRATERAREGNTRAAAVRLAIHVDRCLVGHAAGRAVLDPEDRRRAWAALEQAMGGAEPGAVVTTEAAVAFLEGRFALASVPGPVDGGLRVFRLARPEDTSAWLMRRAGRFVGRREEMTLLDAKLSTAIAGDGQVVGIVGDTGVGKSRLLLEFRQRVRDLAVSYVRGRCVSYGSRTPYLPIVDLLRQLLDLGESDAAEGVRARLHAIFPGTLEEATPWILALLGLAPEPPRAPLSAEAVKTRTFDAVRGLLLSAARRQPLVVVVEGLQWVDPTSEELLASLAERLTGVPLLLLATYRPGYRPPWADRSFATQIALRPLSAEESLALLRSVVTPERLSDPLAHGILARAEGNPLFLEELGQLVTREAPPAAAEIPGTVLQVIAARIDRLSPPARALLQAASVVGREASGRLLREVWSGSEGLEAALRELVAQEFLTERGSLDEPVYVFRHVLTREVAYDGLLPSRRQALHASVAGLLETRAAGRLDPVAADLADHHARAGRPGRAIELLSGAAARAARTSAHAEAVQLLGQAEAHAERLPPAEADRGLVDLALQVAPSLVALGRFAEARDRLVRRETAVDHLDDGGVSARYHFWLAHAHSQLAEAGEAVARAARAIQHAEGVGDPATAGRAYVVLAEEAYWTGEPAAGRAHAQRAMELLGPVGDRGWLGMARCLMGWLWLLEGRLLEGMGAEEEASALAISTGDPRLETYAAWAIAWIHALRGETDAAVDACHRGLARSPDAMGTAVVLGHLGHAYLEGGHPVVAVPLLEQAVDRTGQAGSRRFRARFLGFLAEAYLAADRLHDARGAAREALETATQLGGRPAVAEAQRVSGRVARAGGQLDEAERVWTEALATFEAVGARLMEGRVHLELASVAHALGEGAAQARHATAAAERFRELGLPRALAQAEALGARGGSEAEATTPEAS